MGEPHTEPTLDRTVLAEPNRQGRLDLALPQIALRRADEAIE